MTADTIRQKFLDFFKSKGHTIVASDSLVPKDDPTVLFTTAGMQQFKRQFLGQVDEYTKAATSQKCLRTDDLDEVGKTAYHHTFFEMLGNFSFGDYFKKEAIEWAWEFMTEVVKLPAEKLWVSIYKDDTEAEEIWLKNINIPAKKLVKLGDKNNFWPADAKKNGPNGPCGPCSEIFYDYGPNPDCKKKHCDPSCDCGRFSEIWNLVFTQFNRKEGGVLEPLPNKNIDTGMGLERLVAVVQGKKNNFDTDIFKLILANIEKKIPGLATTKKQIIADHLRAIVFGISDGVIPSNEGRGYVIKKLIIAISEIAIIHGQKDPVIHKIAPSVTVSMKSGYPELCKDIWHICDVIESVEKSLNKILQERIPQLKQEITEVKDLPEDKKGIVLGDLMFKYHDTYGVPLTTFSAKSAETLAVSINDPVIIAGINQYDQKMKKQQKKSRTASKMTGDVFVEAGLNLDVEKTKFLGYEKNQGEAKILKLFVNGQEKREVKQGDAAQIVLDQTPFYAESGGQVGDTGTITKKDALIQVQDTQKTADIFVHTGVVKNGSFKVHDKVDTTIDSERRLSIMRNHTATHLLQSALRKILGTHIQQQGSLVAEDRLRFDFTHPQAVSKKQLAEIRDIIAQRIDAGDPVQTKEMPLQEAKKSGALAFFAEKYGQKVRVVSISDYSKEFCGGTHLTNTKEIQRFEITKEGSVAQGIRRLEAKTGKGAEEFLAEQAKEKEARHKAMESKASQAQEEKTQWEKIKNELKNEIEKAKNKKSPVVAYTIKNNTVSFETLRTAVDFVKQNLKSVVILLGSTSGCAITAVSDDLINRVKANEIIDEIKPLINGNGGGRPQMAQAGTKDPSKIENALKTIKKDLEEKLE